MHIAPKVELVRSLIAHAFAEMGAESEAGPVIETLLVREGIFCGRRFELDGLQAVWFMEEEQVKVYDRSGMVAAVLELDTAEPTVRRAA